MIVPTLRITLLQGFGFGFGFGFGWRLRLGLRIFPARFWAVHELVAGSPRA